MIFEITGLVTISTFTNVEAETEEQALEIAKRRRGMMSIASNNADSADDVWMIEEIDGEPYNLTATKN